MGMKPLVLVGDFETTVFEGQTFTEVWASGVVELFTEDVKIHHSIKETLDYLESLNRNIVIYYHNLKFDGAFWISYLTDKAQYKQAYTVDENNPSSIEWIKDKDMPARSFKYLISDMGMWYTITIRLYQHTIEIRDSLKLLPFSVREIGKSFKTKHQKLEMEYKGFRYSGCNITDEEKEYLANDLLVVKEGLEFMYQNGHDRLTIGSCCLDEFKRIIGRHDYDNYFPNLFIINIDSDKYGSANAGEYIRKSYKGGWCYLVKGKEDKIVKNGVTADVNSLYPSVMSSESGSKYPIGKPTFWKGNYIPEVCFENDIYYFIRIKTRFYLKENKLPCIQIKGSPLYKSNVWLETSDIIDEKGKKYIKANFNGEIYDTRVTMTLTMTDFILIKEHYNFVDFEILDGCYFETRIGLFDEYIDKYRLIKMTSTGAMRQLAKLFLNNLYGKMASTTDSSFKVAVLNDDKTLGYISVEENDKKPGYIAIGSAITSYARNFTIRTAQKNFYGSNKRGFVYADTDSIHCDIAPDKIKGITVDANKFCCWKLESCWDKALFHRQKTYIEHITQENLENVTPYYSIKCAGMPEHCKDLLNKSMTNYVLTDADKEKYTEEEQDFINTPRTMKDFNTGLTVPGKLLPKNIMGGIILQETTYKMREGGWV